MSSKVPCLRSRPIQRLGSSCWEQLARPSVRDTIWPRWSAKTESEYRELFALCMRVMLGLRKLPQPVIARVQGIATAAGCQLVAACDLAVAAR